MLRVNIIRVLALLGLSACTTLPNEKPIRSIIEPKPTPSLPAEFQTQSCGTIDMGCPAIPIEPTKSLAETVEYALSSVKKYPPLVYGAPKPLICSREYAATNGLENRPNLQVMWEHYLYDSPEGVWAEVGGAVEINGCLPEAQGGWRNACTVRLSHMLNKAGYKIPYKKGQTVSGGDGSQYFFRLDDAQAYLEQNFGPPDMDIKDASGHWIDMPNEPGLLIIKFPGQGFTGHATVWNGAGTVDGVDVVGFRVLYWKLPCFIPPKRKLTTDGES